MAKYSVKVYRGKRVILKKDANTQAEAKATKKNLGKIKGVSKIEIVKN